MTAAPPGRPDGAAGSTILYPATAMALGAAACAAAGDGLDLLRTLIVLGAPLVTLGLAFQRNATIVGILLALFIWPLGLLYVLTRRDSRKGEDLGAGRRKPDIPAVADRKPPAPSPTAT